MGWEDDEVTMKDPSKMSEQELEEYFEQEYQKILDQAPPSSKLKLQALQARMNGIKRRYKDPIAKLAQCMER